MFKKGKFHYDSEGTKQHPIFESTHENFHKSNIHFLHDIDAILKKDLKEPAKSIYTTCFFAGQCGINFDKVVQRVCESQGRETTASVDLVVVIKNNMSNESYTLLVESRLNKKTISGKSAEIGLQKIEEKTVLSKQFLGEQPVFFDKTVVLYLDYEDRQEDIRIIRTAYKDAEQHLDKYFSWPAELAETLFGYVGNGAES